MRIFHRLFHNTWFYIALILLIIFLLIYGFSNTKRTFTNTIYKTDTVYVDRPYEKIVIKEVVKPKMVYIYKKDTVYRKQLESETLVNGIELTPSVAKIHTITPEGIVKINKHNFPPFKSLTIDQNGLLQVEPIKHPKRKKILRKIGTVAVFISGVLLGSRLRN